MKSLSFSIFFSFSFFPFTSSGKIPQGSSIGNRCIIGAGCTVFQGEALEDQTVIFGIDCTTRKTILSPEIEKV